MSYEVIREKEVDCPCGKGKVRQVVKENDWFQQKEFFEIQCDECKEKYRVITETFIPKPKHDVTRYFLIDKDTEEKIPLDF